MKLFDPNGFDWFELVLMIVIALLFAAVFIPIIGRQVR